MKLTEDMDARLAEALWAGDVDTLQALAGCECCCWEHTYGNGCPAYQWGGCRGQDSMGRAEEESWARFYEETRGMTRAEFYGYEEAS